MIQFDTRGKSLYRIDRQIEALCRISPSLSEPSLDQIEDKGNPTIIMTSNEYLLSTDKLLYSQAGKTQLKKLATDGSTFTVTDDANDETELDTEDTSLLSTRKREAAAYLFSKGIGYAKVAWILEVSQNTVRDWYYSAKVGKFSPKGGRNIKRYNGGVKDLAVTMRKNGASWRAIAIATGASITTIRSWVVDSEPVDTFKLYEDGGTFAEHNKKTADEAAVSIDWNRNFNKVVNNQRLYNVSPSDGPSEESALRLFTPPLHDGSVDQLTFSCA